MTRFCVAWALALAALAAAPARAEPLTYAEVLQRAIPADASLDIARLQLERARLETARIESQLGWTAGGQTGVSHGLSTFGIPADRVEAGASFERRLKSGPSVGFGLGVAHEEMEAALFPALPNPLRTINVDASYRVPLGRGAGNVDYAQGLKTAEAGIDAAHAELAAVRNQLAQQVAELFHAGAFTYARLRNASDAIERAERLRSFVLRNLRLGIAEEKDRLQVEAQLRARLSEQRALQAAWENARIALNRLMERAWDSGWQPRLDPPPPAMPRDLAAAQAQAVAASPELRRENARVRAAEAAIALRRDAVRDRMDLVFSVGGRRLTGDVPGGDYANTEPVAGIRFEYRAALDDRGAAAALEQAYLERDIARRRAQMLQADLHYAVARLAAEIEALAAALEQAQARQEAERRKLADATRRHREGRANTAELIQFENDYEAAALAVEQQAIELSRRLKELARLTGSIWREIEPPPATTP